MNQTEESVLIEKPPSEKHNKMRSMEGLIDQNSFLSSTKGPGRL